MFAVDSIPQVEKYMTCIPTKSPRGTKGGKSIGQSLQEDGELPPRRNNIHSWSLSPSLPTRKQKHMALI